jgi:cytochrome c-type biogenesis protein CcmH
MIVRRLALAFAACSVLALPARAVQPDEQLSDPRLEARALEISKSLRCVVCQNETIDESDAALAHDLRVIVRERLTAGDTDAQVKDFVVKRYGHYVLLKPPFEPSTLVLWLGPFAVLLLGGVGVALFLRSRRTAAQAGAPALSADEQAELDRLLKPSDPA